MSTRLIQGHSLEVLRTLPSARFHCAVTSPPYWLQRDYGDARQLGREETPAAFVAALVVVFEEVRRVLRDDGTLWLNMGDTYASGGRGGGGSMATSNRAWLTRVQQKGWRAAAPGLKPKDLVGIPWRLAFALQDAGWWLRSDIIWSKPNPLPESIRDRPTKSHEHLFLLAKAESYYYDRDAIREPHIDPRARKASASARRGQLQIRPTGQDDTPERWFPAGGRNRRDVWTIPSQPFSGAHLATMPELLVEPCILAGTSAHGCCPECGAPYSRIVERGPKNVEWIKACGANQDGTYHGSAQKDYAAGKAQDPSAVKARILESMRERKTVGWEAGCECNAGPAVPCEVLDPFVGAGTVPKVADRLGRSATGIDLSAEYIGISRDRIEGQSPLFAEVSP